MLCWGLSRLLRTYEQHFAKICFRLNLLCEIPMVWHEPKNHVADCYFCMVKIQLSLYLYSAFFNRVTTRCFRWVCCDTLQRHHTINPNKLSVYKEIEETDCLKVIKLPNVIVSSVQQMKKKVPLTII